MQVRYASTNLVQKSDRQFNDLLLFDLDLGALNFNDLFHTSSVRLQKNVGIPLKSSGYSTEYRIYARASLW